MCSRTPASLDGSSAIPENLPLFKRAPRQLPVRKRLGSKKPPADQYGASNLKGRAQRTDWPHPHQRAGGWGFLKAVRHNSRATGSRMSYDPCPSRGEDPMALFDDILSGGNLVTGLAIGVGAVVVLPLAAPILRPLAKTVIKG